MSWIKLQCFPAQSAQRMLGLGSPVPNTEYMRTASFGCADNATENTVWLICCERKILFLLKKQAEKYVL
jgi:hypothetical protein